MGDWDTFFRACSLRIHHFGNLLPWAQRALDRLEYGRTEVRPFLEDCITMGPTGDGTIAWPINLSHNFAVRGREKEYTAITKIAVWFEGTDAMPKLRQIFQSQMAGPEERDSSTPYASTVWERIASATENWRTFLTACGRETTRLYTDERWIRTAVSQLGYAENEVRRFLQNCVMYRKNADGTFPIGGILPDNFIMYTEHVFGVRLTSFRGKAALKRFIEWLQAVGVLTAMLWEIRMRDEMQGCSGPFGTFRDGNTGLDGDSSGSNIASEGSMRPEYAMSERSEVSLDSDTAYQGQDEGTAWRGAASETREELTMQWARKYNNPPEKYLVGSSERFAQLHGDAHSVRRVGMEEIVPGCEAVLHQGQRVIDDAEEWLRGQNSPREAGSSQDNRKQKQEVHDHESGHESDGSMHCVEVSTGSSIAFDPDSVIRAVAEREAVTRRGGVRAPRPGQMTRGCKSVCKVRVEGRMCGAQCANPATGPDGWCDWHQYRCGHAWPPTWDSVMRSSNRFITRDELLARGWSEEAPYPRCSNHAECGSWARGVTRCCDTWLCDTCGCWCLEDPIEV